MRCQNFQTVAYGSVCFQRKLLFVVIRESAGAFERMDFRSDFERLDSTPTALFHRREFNACFARSLFPNIVVIQRVTIVLHCNSLVCVPIRWSLLYDQFFELMTRLTCIEGALRPVSTSKNEKETASTRASLPRRDTTNSTQRNVKFGRYL